MTAVLVLNSGLVVAEVPAGRPGSGRSLADGHRRADRRGASAASLTSADGGDSRRRSPTTSRRCAGVRDVRRGGPHLTRWLVAVGHRVVHGGPRSLPADARRRRVGRASSRNWLRLRRCTIRPRVLGIRGRPQGAAGPAARRGVRHRVLPRPAGGGGDLRDRPRHRRAVAHPPLRLSRHVAPVRQRAGGGVSRTAAGRAEPDRAAPGQRRVGVGDRRRPARGHLDGADADGGPGDGHPLRRHRSRASSPTCGGTAEHERRGHRVDAQPALRGARASAARSTSG